MDEASKDECTLSCGYGYSLKNTFAVKKMYLYMKYDTQYCPLYHYKALLL